MNKLLWIVTASLAMSCGSGSDRGDQQEAVADEDVEIGSGAEISPQLQLDSARFDVDSISSPEQATEESRKDDF